MLADLKQVEDKLFHPQALEGFLQKHSVHDLIKALNKAGKKETRDRIKYCFSKVGQSDHYKDLLLSCLTQQADQKKEFTKYVASEHSQQFFTLLQNKPQDVLLVIQNDKEMLPTLLRLVAYEHGIKLIKLFTKLFAEGSSNDVLLCPFFREGMAEGLGLEEGAEVDSVAQMRYFEIAVNMAVRGGPCFEFISSTLGKALNLYKTEDILLKMAMAQIVAGLGEGAEASKLLREHSIWKLVEKDACDEGQQLYVRKFLLVLLVDMSNHGHYEVSSKVIKQLHQFLALHLRSKGEELEAAVDIITHLLKTAQGCRIVIQNMEVLNSYVLLGKSTQDAAKAPFYESLVSLTAHGCEHSKETKEQPKYRLVMNLLNCIGNPNLTAEINHNLHASNYLVYGLNDFAKWFCSLLQLPFEESELRLLEVFSNLLNYYEVMESLLQLQDTTKYLLKQVPPTDSNKLLRTRKATLIAHIVDKGKKDWEGLELSEYSRNLEKMLENSKVETMYALDVE